MKYHIPKGKAKARVAYKRESRGESGVPETREQILKFIKDQSKELQNFIDATDEEKKFTGKKECNETTGSSVFNLISVEDGEHMSTRDIEASVSDNDSDEETLEANEIEI